MNWNSPALVHSNVARSHSVAPLVDAGRGIYFGGDLSRRSETPSSIYPLAAPGPSAPFLPPYTPSPPLPAAFAPHYPPAILVQPPLPKARNAFIMFRSHYIASGQAKDVRLQNDVSRRAADVWHAMSEKDKEVWKEKAAQEKKERAEKAKAYENACMASSPPGYMGYIRPAAKSKSQVKKEKAKTAAMAAALKKEDASARRAERRKAELLAKKSPSPALVSPPPIQVPLLVNGPLVEPEPIPSPPILFPAPPVTPQEPFISDPYTLQSHTYDSPLDTERSFSPHAASLIDHRLVAGDVQILDPNTQTFFAPPLPPLGDFQASIEKPWFANQVVQQAPTSFAQSSFAVPKIQISKVLRESAKAKAQMEAWPTYHALSQPQPPVIDPKMLDPQNDLQLTNVSGSSSSSMPIMPGTAFSPMSAPSPSDFASPMTPYSMPSHSSFVSRTPSPSFVPYAPAPMDGFHLQLYAGYDANGHLVPAAIPNTQKDGFKAKASQQVVISDAQNKEWTEFGIGGADWQSMAGAGFDPSAAIPGYANNGVGAYEEFYGMNMPILGMEPPST